MLDILEKFMGNNHTKVDERPSYGRNYIKGRLMINITKYSSNAVKAELWKL
jgi:hypothetical protein